MRPNRGTILLVVAALVVIVVVSILNNDRASAPGEPTPTPGVANVPLFAGAAADSFSRVDVVDNTLGSFVTVSQDAGGAWGISATNAADRAADQTIIATQMTTLSALQGEGSFVIGTTDQPLSAFGLENPAYVITVTAGDTDYTLHVGGENPAGNRYYVVVTSAPAAERPAAEATAEVAPEAETTPEATAEATPEAEATADPEATPEADAFGASSLLLQQAPRPAVSLSGEQTVQLVSRETLRTLIGWIASPPYVLPPTLAPTATPTLNPMSEVEIATATAEFLATQQAQFAATATAMAEVTPEATAEASAEATAETTPES
jgi:hypothetical protein